MPGGMNWGGEIRRHRDYFRAHQSSPELKKLHPELVGVGEMKSSRNIQGTCTGYNQKDFLSDGWIWGEQGEREVTDDPQGSDLGNQVDGRTLIKRNAEEEMTLVWSRSVWSDQGELPDGQLEMWAWISAPWSELEDRSWDHMSSDWGLGVLRCPWGQYNHEVDCVILIKIHCPFLGKDSILPPWCWACAHDLLWPMNGNDMCHLPSVQRL